MLLHLIRRRCTNSAFLSFRIQKRYAKIEFAFSGVDFNNGQKLRSFSTGAVTKSYHEGTENFESYKDLEKDIDLNNSIALRSYQKECIDTICKTLSNGASKIAVSIATGGGKTVIFCKTIPTLLKIRRYDGDISNGILVLVHRRELAKQTIDTILRMNIVDKDRVFLDMGTSALDPKIFLDNRPFIVVGSVPTLARNDCKRLACYNKSKFKAVIVDECHHAVSKSYLDIFNTMNCSKELHGKPSDHKDGEIGPFLLGFTATLARADKQPLKKAFDEIVFQKGILSLIEENHLCDLEWLRVEIGLNLSKVEVQGGDFNTASLAQHVNTDEVNSIVLKSYIQMKTRFPDNMNLLLAFCVNVKHMQDLSLLFQANGINAQYVSGETKISERDAIIHDFKRGKVPVLFNCGVFTEGTDIPNIDSIFLVRPTKSKPLLIQMIGRGLRLHEGKKKLLVTDFVDNKSLGLTITSTLGGKSEILSLLGGTTGTGFNHRNEMLGGDVDYIKFARFSGKELFDENPDKQNPAYVLMQKMRLLNSKSALGNWIQVKFNTWATPCGYKSYLKIESDQNGKYKAHYCFSKLGFKDSIRLISTTIAEDPNFTDVIDSVKEYVVKHEFINDEMKAISLRESHMKHASITKSQRNFIANTVMDIVEKSQSYAMDMDKFKKVFNEKVESMSRLEASDFIFGFTVGRKQSAMIWIKQNFLRNKNQRALITKETVLQEKQALMDGGWT